MVVPWIGFKSYYKYCNDWRVNLRSRGWFRDWIGSSNEWTCVQGLPTIMGCGMTMLRALGRRRNGMVPGLNWPGNGRERGVKVIGHVRWSYYATFYEFLAYLGANKVMDFWKVLDPLRNTEDGEKNDYQNGLV
ncbi:hypothetical protein R6Q59_016641 [Mikania micrantha]